MSGSGTGSVAGARAKTMLYWDGTGACDGTGLELEMGSGLGLCGGWACD